MGQGYSGLGNCDQEKQTWEKEFSGIRVFEEVLEKFPRKGRVDDLYEPSLRPQTVSIALDYKSGDDLKQEYQSKVPPLHLEATLGGKTEGVNGPETEGAV